MPRLLHNVTALTLQRAFNMGLNLVVTLAVVRFLGAEAYGIYQYAVACGVLMVTLESMRCG